MCGRYNLTTPAEEIIETFRLDELGATIGLKNYKPSYNIAPGQDAPIVRSIESGKDMTAARWGGYASLVKGTQNKILYNCRHGE